jgi:hypothetical protein
MQRSFKYLSPVLVTGLIIFSVGFGIRQISEASTLT